jgi:hypothetical protein
MMIVLGTLCLVIVVLLLGLQVFWACRFALSFPPQPIATDEAQLPFAAVILCVRGADPSLPACLRGLFQQDYPRFQIRIVLDSAADPAFEVLCRALGENPPANVKALVLENPEPTCSLKVSALMQAMGELDDAIETVALIDADVIPYRHWLRDLMAPFADPGVGATTGFRWYVPNGKTNWWTLVRSMWNAGACTQMAALHIPWGGSLALRTSLFRVSDLFDRWSRSFGEDTSCHRVVCSQGLRLEFVPAVTMVNHDSIGAKRGFAFIRRQLISARLGHENWPAVLALGLGTPLAVVAAMALAVATWAAGGWALASGLAAALVLYALGLGLCLAWADRQINRMVQARGEAPYSFSWPSLLAGPFTMAVYLACLVSASFVRRVEWRGITYTLEGARRIRMVEYRPFRNTVRERDPHPSLA